MIAYPRDPAPFLRLVRATFDPVLEDQNAGHGTLCVCGHSLGMHDVWGGACMEVGCPCGAFMAREEEEEGL
jgi:hypothetical protein